MSTGLLFSSTFVKGFNRFFSSGVVEPIRSFIFLDLETTGLHKPVSITEVGLIAVSRGRLLRRWPGKPKTPRVLDKLTVCVNPRKRIHYSAERLSGLSNVSLANHKKFDEDLAFSIVNFIKRQPSPAVLVGHNGDAYDFEIFFEHLYEHNIELPTQLKVVDSLKGFRYLKNTGTLRLGEGKEDSACDLVNLFKHLVGEEYPPHSAEYDCLALLKCVQNIPALIPWMDENAHDIKLPGDLKTKSNTLNKTRVIAPNQKGSSKDSTKFKEPKIDWLPGEKVTYQYPDFDSTEVDSQIFQFKMPEKASTIVATLDKPKVDVVDSVSTKKSVKNSTSSEMAHIAKTPLLDEENHKMIGDNSISTQETSRIIPKVPNYAERKTFNIKTRVDVLKAGGHIFKSTVPSKAHTKSDVKAASTKAKVHLNESIEKRSVNKQQISQDSVYENKSVVENISDFKTSAKNPLGHKTDKNVDYCITPLKTNVGDNKKVQGTFAQNIVTRTPKVKDHMLENVTSDRQAQVNISKTEHNFSTVPSKEYDDVVLSTSRPNIKVPVARQECCLRSDGDFVVRNILTKS